MKFADETQAGPTSRRMAIENQAQTLGYMESRYYSLPLI